MNRRIPLNACDLCILAQHRLGYVAHGAANLPYLMVDLNGHVPEAALRAAFERACAMHPSTLASLATSPLRIRPFWRLPRDVGDAARVAVSQACLVEDLTTSDDATRRLDELCQSRYLKTWDLRRGPQVRMERYLLPGNRTRLVLRWPHYFTDAEGAQLFLAAMDDYAPDHCLPDGTRTDPVGGMSFVRRVSLARQGLTSLRALGDVDFRSIVPANNRHVRDMGDLHRHWDESQFTLIREHARRTTPPGQALYARYLAAAVGRALHRLYTEKGVRTGAYMITMPLQVGRASAEAAPPARTSLPGNFLVSPTLCILHDEAEHRETLAQAIQSQLERFLSTQGDLAQWALLEGAALLHHWFYDWIFKLPFSGDRYSSGFSYFTEIAQPLRVLGGARVTNIWGGGPTTTPPGWNPVFTRFADRLNLSLSYNRPAVPDELAELYAALIESEVLDPT